MNRSKSGYWYGVGAYACWGLAPLYWKLLLGVPVLQLIGHRVFWSSVLLTSFMALSGQGRPLWRSLADPHVLKTYAIAASLVAVNWFLFIWAVNAGFIVETSLGYFINPLFSVVIAVVVLGEKLRPWQWVAVGLASAGVIYLTVAMGKPPWISLALATTFALYGLVKKRAPLGSVHGLTVETGLLALPALLFLLWSEQAGTGAFLREPPVVSALLFVAGAITIAPLLMFATAAQRIPLLWVGILQYIAPTMQLAIGVLVYGESFGSQRLMGFSLVWAALMIFVVEGVMAHRATAVVAPPE